MNEQNVDGKNDDCDFWYWKPNEVTDPESDYYLGHAIMSSYLNDEIPGSGSRLRDGIDVILVKTEDGMYRIIPTDVDDDTRFEECGPWEDEQEAIIRFMLMTQPIEC